MRILALTLASVLASAFLLLFLAACATHMPDESKIGLPANESANLNTTVPAEAPQVLTPVVPTEADFAEMEQTAKDFAYAWQRFNVSAMYPLLHSPLRGRVSGLQLEDLLVYFQPKDKVQVVFDSINKTDDGYAAVMTRGTDIVGWSRHMVPVVLEADGWRVAWFDDITTPRGILESCRAKVQVGEDDPPEVLTAKMMSASSCIANGAKVLKDVSLCAHATYDRQRCYSNLGVALDRDGWVQVCVNETDEKDDAVSRANCLREVAAQQEDISICREIDTKRVERYFCIGELAALKRAPYECNDAINDYTLKLCLQEYVKTVGNDIDVCDNPAWQKFFEC